MVIPSGGVWRCICEATRILMRLDYSACGRGANVRSTATPGPLAICLGCRALFASGPTMTPVLGPAPWAEFDA